MKNTKDKGKNPMQKGKKSMQQEGPQQVHNSDEESEFQWKEIEDVEIPSMFPMYMPPRKLGAKPLREPKEGKFSTYVPLLHEEVPS